MALYLVRVGLGAEGVSTSHSAKLKIELGLWLLFRVERRGSSLYSRPEGLKAPGKEIKGYKNVSTQQ